MHPILPCSQVALEFGKPMVISPDDVNSDAFKFDEYAEVKRLTGCLEEKMRDVTLNASDFGTIKIARSMRRLYLNTPGSIAANEEVRLTQHIIDMLEKPSVKEEQQQKIADVRAKVEKYREELGRLRMKDQEIILPVEKKNSLLQVFLERALYLLVLLPLATPGIVLHFPYYFVGTFGLCWHCICMPKTDNVDVMRTCSIQDERLGRVCRVQVPVQDLCRGVRSCP